MKKIKQIILNIFYILKIEIKFYPLKGLKPDKIESKYINLYLYIFMLCLLMFAISDRPDMLYGPSLAVS